MGAATVAWLDWRWPTELDRSASAALLAAMVGTGAGVYVIGSLVSGASELRGLLRLRGGRR
jgi:hypothetical protein